MFLAIPQVGVPDTAAVMNIGFVGIHLLLPEHTLLDLENW
jgi:hypothetical protein